MTCTEAKRNANRQNATRSTGPRTKEGKARSSRNALKHGFRASASSLTPLEDRDAYHSYTASIVHSLHPRTPMEDDLAHRIADLSWRLRRIPDAESALLTRDTVHDLTCRARGHHEDEAQQPREQDPQPEWDDDDNDNQDKDEDEPHPLPESPARLLAAAMAVPRNPYLTLQRYEASLDRARSRALKELRQLQKDRRAHPEDESPVRNETTAPTKAHTPSPLEGEGVGEGEACELQPAPERNEPTPPPQVTNDHGPVTAREVLPNEPTAPSVSSVAEHHLELRNEAKPQSDRPPRDDEPTRAQRPRSFHSQIPILESRVE